MTREERDARIAELRANQNRQPAEDAELERLYNMRDESLDQPKAEEPKEEVKPVKKPKSKKK